MSKEKIRPGRVVVYAGALLAYFIGAGFASGQEVLQFYSAWGHDLFIVAAVAFFMIAWSVISYARAGAVGEFTENSQVFKYYCGKYIGTFFDYFSVIYCFCCYIYMCAGAGSTLNQRFGIPSIVGAILMAALVIVSVFLGLHKITEILGRLGTAIIVLVLFIALWNLIANFGDLGANLTAISEDYTQFGMERTIAPNAFMAGVSYVGATIIWTTAFVAMMSSKADRKREVKIGMAVGAVFIALGLLLCALAIVSVAGQVGASDIPTLLMAANIWEPLASIYAIFIVAGIYTSAVPLLWTSTARFTKEGTPRFKLLCTVLGIAGLVIALFVPYKTLVNYILTLGGYVVCVFFVILVVTDIRRMVLARRAKEALAADTTEPEG